MCVVWWLNRFASCFTLNLTIILIDESSIFLQISVLIVYCIFIQIAVASCVCNIYVKCIVIKCQQNMLCQKYFIFEIIIVCVCLNLDFLWRWMVFFLYYTFSPYVSGLEGVCVAQMYIKVCVSETERISVVQILLSSRHVVITECEVRTSFCIPSQWHNRPPAKGCVGELYISFHMVYANL